ncbi:hypothetical protein [Peribacillus sp. SCS-155]|uniref:hypothetical protein n=1 Tax=Peribacillus sedimenti TaxID=3115297 RepID=UPI0039069E7B
MLNKVCLLLTAFAITFALYGCSEKEESVQTTAEFWNGLDRNQKHILVSTELHLLKASGFTILVEEYYFIDRLDSYYNDNQPGHLPVKDALKKIGFSAGVIQT